MSNSPLERLVYRSRTLNLYAERLGADRAKID